MIANYFGSMVPAYHGESKAAGRFPRTLNLNFIKKQDMRYGEKQPPAGGFLYRRECKEASVATATQLQGKALSYNNIADTDAALECVKSSTSRPALSLSTPTRAALPSATRFLTPTIALTKPTRPPRSAASLPLTARLDAETAQAIISRQFVEVIIAPSASEEALKITAAKQNVRVLTCGQWDTRVAGLDFKRVNGGLLVPGPRSRHGHRR